MAFDVSEFLVRARINGRGLLSAEFCSNVSRALPRGVVQLTPWMQSETDTQATEIYCQALSFSIRDDIDYAKWLK